MADISKEDESKNKDALNGFIKDLDRLAPIEKYCNDPNIFKILSVGEREIRHSNFLAWLMDPNGNHNLGDKFIKQYLETVMDHTENRPFELYQIEMMDFSDLIVKREQCFKDDKNRKYIFDILIKSKNEDLLIVVENKIYSKQGNQQLLNYRVIAEQYFKDYKNKLFIFQTLKEEVPDDSAWVTADYQMVHDILDTIIVNDNISDKVRRYIKDYNSTLEEDELSNEEIEKACKEIYRDHKAAIDLINYYNNDDDRKHFSEAVIEFLKKKLGDDAIFLTERMTQIRFTTPTIRNKFGQRSTRTWSNGAHDIVIYEINLWDGGTDIILEIQPGDMEIRQRIYDEFKKNKTLFNSTKKDVITKNYSRVFSLKMKIEENESIEYYTEKWIEKLDKEFFGKSYKSIDEAIKNMNFD